jgi:short-subunit dehydrogenase
MLTTRRVGHARAPSDDALLGAHVVVTGASRGIGASLAREFSARGARITGVARSAEALTVLANEVGGAAVCADLTEPAQLSTLLTRIEDERGPVDILVNNAGVALVDRLVDQDADAIRQSFALNVLAPLELTRQVLPGMLTRGRGGIVNISSLAGITAFPTLSTYGATKAALVHFSAGLQRELRRTPVRVTIVQLGEVAGTEMMEAARTSPTIAAVSRRLARVHALPPLTTGAVAVAVVDAAATGRRHCVVPRRVLGMHLIRELPSRLNDAVLYRID